jgi:Uma2 family endonuclease
MTGASHRHNVIAVNITSMLHAGLRDHDCFIYGGDMKVEVDPGRHYAYPDASIVCGGVDFVEGRTDVFKNPLVLFEILSKSTKDYDLGTKFKAYRNIPSLRDYIVVDQYAVFVTLFHKNEAGQWTLKDFDNLEDVVLIGSLGLEMDMEEIYRRIEIESDEA